MRWAWVAIWPLGLFLLSESTSLSTSAKTSEECKSIGLTRFTLNPKDESKASVVIRTPHGEFEAKAVRTGKSTARMRFRHDGREMTPTKLANAPSGVKACLSEKAQEMSHRKNAKRFYCYVVDEPRCENDECFVLACCLVGNVQVCGTGTSAF